jgi:predicted dinucleotide-binding enzyme
MSREVMAEINDPHVAAQLFIEQVRAGNPNARAIRNADMVVAAWRYTYRRYTTPPMAWLDSNGNIVIDGTRVDPRIAPGYGPGGAGF